MDLWARFAPGAHPKEPDRFAEGFSLFVGSGALVGLWSTGSLRLPSGPIAEFFYFLIVTLGVFGFLWLTFGLVDRYAGTFED